MHSAVSGPLHDKMNMCYIGYLQYVLRDDTNEEKHPSRALGKLFYLRAVKLTKILVLPSLMEVVSANLSRCCLVPISGNYVLEGFSRCLLRLIQESMSDKVEEKSVERVQ